MQVYHGSYTASRVELLSPSGARLSVLGNAQVVSFSERFKDGAAQILIPKADAVNVSEWQRLRIKLWRESTAQFETAWTGFIIAPEPDGEYVRLGCKSLYEKLKRRCTSSALTLNGAADVKFGAVITEMNATTDTGLDFEDHASAPTDNVNLVEKRTAVFTALDNIVGGAGSGEWYISNADTPLICYRDRRGTDKTASIHLIYQDDRDLNSRITRYRLRRDAEKLLTRVIGRGEEAGGAEIIASVEDDTLFASRDLLEQVIEFPSARDSDTVTNLATDYLNQVKNPLIELEVVPIQRKTIHTPFGDDTVGYEWHEFCIGDDISITFKDSQATISGSRRIVGMEFRNERGLGEIWLILSSTGVRYTSDYLLGAGEREDILMRLRQIEARL